ncbi:hypothetical protein COF68_04455 [Bacillus toyonensis]|uniref:hypothetical protein n=1 Tax=Bacillus toyonensis TaxID=155322 RepID=UPI000BFD2CEB|nr:hypothetical protein [Bacillus toyonensis]PHE64107.1 hypothetical protein COF68_04455 [Bacillus toyonensis]
MENKLDSLEVTKEEDKTILFNATGSFHEDKLALRDKRKTLFDLRTATFDKNRKKTKLNVFPFRKNVEIDTEKYAKYRRDYDNYSSNKKSALQKFVRGIRTLIKEGTLHEHFNLGELNDPRLMDRNFETIIELIFQQCNNSIEVEQVGFFRSTEYISIEDYHENKKLMKRQQLARHFSGDLNDITVENVSTIKNISIPIYHKTSPFIKFEKGQALISFELETTSEITETVTNRIINRFITAMQLEGVDIVNYINYNQMSILNVLCSNEEVDGVLENFSKVFKSFYSPLFTKSYYTSIDVQYNVGQEDETINYYVLLSGGHYQPLADKLVLTGETYLGFKVCK